jgi:hypothetical protein
MVHGIGAISGIIVIIIIICIMNNYCIAITTTMVSAMMIIIIMMIDANSHNCKRCKIGRRICISVRRIIWNIYR